MIDEQLNVLVADVVMEWRPRHAAHKCDGTRFIKCGAAQIACGEFITCCEEARRPNYLGDMAAAWQIVEKLQGLFGHILIDWFDDQWHVLIANADAGFAADPDVRRAICLAALRWKGVALSKEEPTHVHQRER